MRLLCEPIEFTTGIAFAVKQCSSLAACGVMEAMSVAGMILLSDADSVQIHSFAARATCVVTRGIVATPRLEGKHIERF